MHNSQTTITQFIIEEQRHIAGATGDFTALLNDIVTACKMLAHYVGRGSLINLLGTADTQNVQGETQKKLDVIANEVLIKFNQWAGHLAGMASEEMDDVYQIPLQYPRGKYLLLFDPLDGSSNIDVNIPTGTIFSILRCPPDVEQASMKDFLQPGTQQVCAGYALYGAATMLILTTGHGVNSFTLNSDIGEFVLTRENLKIPADTQEFAINLSNMRFWDAPTRRYIDECVAGKTGVRGKDFNMRWVGSMVGDVHRVLSRGGIFLYPVDSKTRDKGGRLRLMYEANPMAFLIEQAGGVASTGKGRILEEIPHTLHQRTSVIVGSANEVNRIISYYAEN